MTRFVIDAAVVLKLVSEDIEVAPEHELLAPTLVRSQTLSMPTRPSTAATSRRTSGGTDSSVWGG